MLTLLSNVCLAQDTPFYPRQTSNNTDIGGINQNYQQSYGNTLNRTTKNITPQFCLPGQTLLGAVYNKHGATYGGTCSTVIVSSATSQTISGIIVSTGLPTSVSSCGGGSPSVQGSDNSGAITTGTSATACTLNFSSSHGSPPNGCVVSSTSPYTAAYITSIGASNVIFNTSYTLTSAKWFYVCF